MDIKESWPAVERLFRDAAKSSFHYAIATVKADGQPHVTPIGSLMLDRPGHGFYFEEFSRQMVQNYADNSQVCVLAVNSDKWFWLKSLLGGRFKTPPAVRLMGTVGELREATDKEIALWRKQVRQVRFTRGHALMWRNMKRVREIHFDRIETVNIGRMTQGAWSNDSPVAL